MRTLDDLFEETSKDVYFAENAILKALPKMAAKAKSKDLKAAFTEHTKETEGQVKRLDKIFKVIGKKPEGKECPALKGLVKETEELMSEAQNADVLDAGLIGCAQAVEHYEMARYGTLCAWAEQLDMEDAAELLEETLEEEKAADEKLTELAESSINENADSAEDDSDGDEDEEDDGENDKEEDKNKKPAASRKRSAK